ncbi:hypothetical protein BVH03_04510 [Pseudomonas sp. PA15(2017)]|uniref:hypothetical protein n=1 Tax=Pseudomonas sp. PA15(2017) TaxID=1932111 RepID=UPI000963F3A9|nr:hypothetical protein [Pseudomonas sp. PA15(2017)]OLU33691.1 hypothetical protein BVH03_04510 [Pseudomonas sp. PA15(2017)]
MTSQIGVSHRSPVQNLRPNDEPQPAESSSRNQGLQIRRSSSPPINPLQFSELVEGRAQKLSASLKTLLQGDLKNLKSIDMEKNPLEFARQHMMMEGRLLGSSEAKEKKMLFEHAQNYLQSLGRAPHPWIDGTEEAAALKQDLHIHADSRGDFSPQAFEAVLNNHTKRLGDQLVAYHLLYKEALNSNTLQPHEKAQIETSHKAYRDYAARSIHHIANHLPDTINAFLDTRVEMAKRAAGREGLTQEGQETADKTVARWESAKESFIGASGALDVEALEKMLKPAMNNIRVDERVAKLKADQADKVKQTQVFMGGGIPQGVASFLHFGLARNAANMAMDGKIHPAAQGSLAGLNLGIAHKVVSDGPRALVQNGVDRLFTSAVVKVDPTEVLPDAPRVISVDGRKVVRDDEALDHEQSLVEKDRAGFKREQRNHYFGTLTGDHEYFESFGGANFVKTALVEFTDLISDSLIARATTSGLAGLTAGGIQPLAKYRNTWGPDKIPTHTLGNTQAQTMSQLGNKVLQDIQFWKGDSAGDTIGKVFGAIQGEYISNVGLGSVRDLLDDDSVQQKIGRMFVDLIASPAILSSFLPNVGATAKAAATASGVKGTDRQMLPWKNITDPNEQSRKDRQGLQDADLGLAGNAADVATSIHTAATGVLRALPQSLVAAQMKLEKNLSEKPQDQPDIEMTSNPGVKGKGRSKTTT